MFNDNRYYDKLWLEYLINDKHLEPNYIKFANFYNEMSRILSAICVEKGGIALENYVGRFFAADVLEYIVEYGNRLKQSGETLDANLAGAMDLFEKQFERVKDLVTPNQKPIYEMSIEEFEKIMKYYFDASISPYQKSMPVFAAGFFISCIIYGIKVLAEKKQKNK